jgi:tetratricopeptide (TPR) repeat protein
MLRMCLVVILFISVLCSLPASAQSPENADFHALSKAALRAQHDGQSAEAIRLYTKALKLRPEWPEGWRNVGMLLADRREFSRASTAFQNLLEIEPKNVAGWALLGLCEYEMRQYDDALKHLQHARVLGIPSQDLDTIATYHAALLLIRKGEFVNAQPLLIHVAKQGSQDPDLILAFGRNALRLTSATEDLDARQGDLVREVGQIEYYGIHHPVPEVIKAYEKLLSEHPKAIGVHYAFGNFLINNAHYDRGLEEMRKELELTPNDLMTLLQIAMTYLKTNEPGLGLPYAEKAVQSDPKSFAAHYALGWSLFRLGRNELAIPELEQVIRLEPDLPEGHFALSQAYQRAGRKAEADREREKFAQLKQQEVPPGAAPAGREQAEPR